ncbi:MAG: acyl carrier protein [Deltaproteobacteria bacterium]
MLNGILGQIKLFILKNFPLAKGISITDEQSLLDTGVIDSVGILEIVNFVQEEFGVMVEDEELVPENFQSILSIAGFVEKKLGGAHA